LLIDLGEIEANFVDMARKPKTKIAPTIDDVAVDLIKRLDGYSIEEAQEMLARASTLLSTTQIVSAKAPLLN
jgi:hypothetical protein